MNKINFESFKLTIPELPGIYKYFDAQNTIIYIGKAKNLKKRISNYFVVEQQNSKTIFLVKSIAKIEFIIVDKEHDALLLENNLIKQHQPKYNINLKDDKTFPYLVIKNEPFPRIFFTRQKRNDGATYLGPYTNVMATRMIYDLIAEHFQLRTCNLNLHPDVIKRSHYKVCLNYHIKKCLAPCVSYQSEESYNSTINEIQWLLKTNLREIVSTFKNQMNEAAENLNFELANIYKTKIDLIENFNSKSIVESNSNLNLDVFAIEILNSTGLVHFMKVREGKIIVSSNFQLETKLDERIEDILEFAIIQQYIKEACEVEEIICPLEIEILALKATVHVPKIGDKKKFLDLAIKNILYLKFEIRRLKMNLNEAIDKDKKEILEQLKKDLHLQHLPVYIECFDNSNFQGSYPVSAMVCFRNGEAFKNDYRVFKIKTVSGIDDFATMREVVYRRYSKLQKQNLPLPNLIIIDGGKGQLNAAIESLKKLNLEKKTTVIGLAKNNEEIFFANDKDSLVLQRHEESLKLIIQIRDEVHRFGVQFHRKLRQQGTIKTELNNIDGIGEALAQKLLRHYGSVKQIKETNEIDLANVVGAAKARLVANYFSLK